jgi:hypothetical protein
MNSSALERVRAEYLEMPGLQLTLGQVHRLCGIERTLCEEVLGMLVNEHFLYMKTDGRYALFASEGARARPAKAYLPSAQARHSA